MALPTDTEIDNAVPVDGVPHRGNTNSVLKALRDQTLQSVLDSGNTASTPIRLHYGEHYEGMYIEGFNDLGIERVEVEQRITVDDDTVLQSLRSSISPGSLIMNNQIDPAYGQSFDSNISLYSWSLSIHPYSKTTRRMHLLFDIETAQEADELETSNILIPYLPFSIYGESSTLLVEGDIGIKVASASQGEKADSAVQSETVKNLWTGTQAEYDAISDKDPNTWYLVSDE